MSRLELFDGKMMVCVGDLTTLSVDMIVNAANASLCGGGGVDGAIHRVAGPELLAECRTLGGAKTGEVKLTRGYGLPSRFVAHAVGPVWSGGGDGEAAALARCYRGALSLAIAEGCSTIAFPSISTGAYRFPIEKAAPIALETTRSVLFSDAGSGLRATFCCFSTADFVAYVRAAKMLWGDQA